MLIGIDASRANRKYKSGTEWYSYYLIRELAKLDNKNQYLLYSDQPLVGGLADLTLDDLTDEPEVNPARNILKGNSTVAELQGIISNGVKVKAGWQEIISPFSNFRAKILSWPWPFFWTQLRLSIEMLIHRPDILFIPAHTLPLIHPKKSVITIHDIGFIRERHLYSSEFLGPKKPFSRKIVNGLVKIFTKGKYGANMLDYLDWSTKFGLNHVEKVITVSYFSKNEIKEIYQLKEDKVKVIYNGFSRHFYQKVNDQNKIKEILSKYGINDPFIFYVGRLEKKKNIRILVNAYAIMRDKYKKIKHKLVLVGMASHGFDEINYIIQEFNLNDEVIITGWIPEEDMPYIFNGATAFVFPSLYEGFGIPLLQAMACGTPIAASRTASIPEVAGQAALYFDPNDKREMADKMAEIITNLELRDKLVKQGFKRVKNFSWEKCAKETLAVLENL